MLQVVNQRWAEVAACAGLLVALAGCATPYKPLGFTGGYSDFRVAQDEFQISFNGNGYTPRMRVDQYLLRRASEVTLDSGYTHFAEVQRTDDTRRGVVNSSSGSATAYSQPPYNTAHAYGSGSGLSREISAPGSIIRIKCFRAPLPDAPGLVDAQAYLRFNQFNYPDAASNRITHNPRG